MSQPLAVLIDAENIGATFFPALLRDVANLGNPIVWQLHGDLLGPSGSGWQEVAKSGSMDIRHQPHTGKNSADIAMTIAAMDLMREGIVRGICLVSSDRDFVPLARRLRAGNLDVYGFGRGQTGDAFKLACTRFVELTPAPRIPPQSQVFQAAAVPKAPPSKFTAGEKQELRRLLLGSFGPSGEGNASAAGTAISRALPHIAGRLVGTGKLVDVLTTEGVARTKPGSDRQVLVVLRDN